MSHPGVLPATSSGRGGRRNPRGQEVGPGTDVGGYTVEAPLGAGGFGTVFRAQRGGELYALKVLPLEEVGEWAVRELLNLAKVRHPNVVRLLGHCQWPDKAPRYFVIIMEYVPGRRLDVWASTENPSAREVMGKVLGLARALAALHAVKVIHRDVKEANVLVRDSDGEVVLVDLGVGGDEDGGWRTGGLLPPGTPDYRSPEAWRFERENQGVAGAHYRPAPSDDLYALGVVLYWLLTNRKPFHVEGRRSVDAVLAQAPTPPHVLNPRVPVELGELCLRLLAKRPEERPADAREVCTALMALLERRGAVWEEPLCEAFSEHTVTTRLGPGGDEVTHYLKAARAAEERPRRGRRPPVAVEHEPAALPSVPLAPAADQEAPPAASEGAQHRPARTWSASLRVAVGVALVTVLGGGLAWFVGNSQPTSPAPFIREAAREPRPEPFEYSLPELTWEVGWKVAPPWKPPEATGREQGVASMKNTQQKQQKQPKGLGPVGKAITTGSACLTLACTGPQAQVRSEPPGESCPSGALEAMAARNIDIGEREDALFPPRESTATVISVREGWTSIRVLPGLGDMKEFYVKGRLLFGAGRVYGRFTQAEDPNGTRTWPICLELLDDSSKRGIEMESGSTADAARIFNSARVKAVGRFE